MSLSGPATAWAWMQSNISGETWNAPMQPDRTWDAKKQGEEWQIIAKFWYAKLIISYPERLEAVKALQLSTELRVGRLFNSYLWSCDYSVFALSLWCIEWRLMWRKKSYSKQFNIIQQHNKTWKKWRGMNDFYRNCIYCIYIYIYMVLVGGQVGSPLVSSWCVHAQLGLI